MHTHFVFILRYLFESDYKRAQLKSAVTIFFSNMIPKYSTFGQLLYRVYDATIPIRRTC